MSDLPSTQLLSILYIQAIDQDDDHQQSSQSLRLSKQLKYVKSLLLSTQLNCGLFQVDMQVFRIISCLQRALIRKKINAFQQLLRLKSSSFVLQIQLSSDSNQSSVKFCQSQLHSTIQAVLGQSFQILERKYLRTLTFCFQKLEAHGKIQFQDEFEEKAKIQMISESFKCLKKEEKHLELKTGKKESFINKLKQDEGKGKEDMSWKQTTLDEKEYWKGVENGKRQANRKDQEELRKLKQKYHELIKQFNQFSHKFMEAIEQGG